MMKFQLGVGVRKSLNISNLVTFILLLIFIAASYIIEVSLKPQFSHSGLILTGLIMAIIPAAIWLIFFYRQEQTGPEPKGMVLAVAALGALIAAGIGIPLVENIFQVSNWIYTDIRTNLIGGILVIGFSQEFLKYAALRFSVFNSSEFDEREDGIIYGTAVGIGFAAALNVAYIVNSGGALLGVAAIRVVLTTLAQASFAGLCGYFLSKEKIENKPAWWMPFGIAIASILNGVFFFLWGTLTQPKITIQGGYVNPWAGLTLAVIVAILTMAFLSWRISEDEKSQIA